MTMNKAAPLQGSARVGQMGFTFVELIVALAIMIMMAAVVTPVLLGSLDNARVQASHDSLIAVRDAILAFEEDVDRYPSSLDQLVDEIGGSGRDICNRVFGNNFKEWDGPYLAQEVPSAGIPTPIGRIRNELSLWPSSHLMIQVDSVQAADAVELNSLIDDDSDLDAYLPGLFGSIRWSFPVNGLVTLFYWLPVSC